MTASDRETRMREISDVRFLLDALHASRAIAAAATERERQTIAVNDRLLSELVVSRAEAETLRRAIEDAIGFARTGGPLYAKDRVELVGNLLAALALAGVPVAPDPAEPCLSSEEAWGTNVDGIVGDGWPAALVPQPDQPPGERSEGRS